MKCPGCQNDLQPVNCKGIVIDECLNCKGKWFDRDELRKAKDSADESLRWLDFDPFSKEAEQLSIASEEKKCPKCSNNLASLKYMDSTIVIDKCLQCKGVWLEPKELTRIIRYLEKRLSTETAKEYAADAAKQFMEIFTGHEGIVSEVKDFLAVFYLLELRIAVEHPTLANTAQKIYRPFM